MGFLAGQRQLSVDAVGVFRGERLLFEQLTFSLTNGSLLHIKGSNGSGKTSLLRTISALSKPYSGEIKWCGEDVFGLAEDYYKNILYLGHLLGVKEDLTAIENLSFSLSLLGIKPNGVDERIKEVMTMLGLSNKTNQPIRSFSQGQKRRVALSKLWLQPAHLWILDEPFTALDVNATQLLKERIEEFSRGGGIVVITTHQDFAFDVPDFQQIRLDA